MRRSMTEAKNPAAENRRLQLRRWIDANFGGSQSAFIASTNDGEKQVNQGELSGLLGSKSFGEKRARNLEKQAGMPTHYLEQTPGAFPKITEHQGNEPRQSAVTGWPFARVPLSRLIALKRNLGPHKGVEAMHDLDETLELAVLKWERRISQTKSRAA